MQAGTFAATDADMVTAITMTNVEEAIGVDAGRQGAPACPSRSPSRSRPTAGCRPAQPLQEAIDAGRRGDRRARPLYYMINCAHPTHFAGTAGRRALDEAHPRHPRQRLDASHAELDAATELDAGDPDELGRRYARSARRYPRINVLGGCCGTDHRHIAAIGHACAAHPVGVMAVNGAAERLPLRRRGGVSAMRAA